MFNKHIYSRIEREVDIYSKSLIQLIKLVAESDESVRKERYLEIIRELLSKYELWLIFYHGLRDEPKNELRPIIEKYSLLKNLKKKILFAEVNRNDDYAPSAYGIEISPEPS